MKSGKIRHWQKKQVNISSTYWTAHSRSMASAAILLLKMI